MTVRKRILVAGRVQGVFYRETCRRVAEAAGVAGSARNLDDGRVEVVLEGADDAVVEVVRWCGQGPDHAHVTGVEVIDEPPTGTRGFSTL
ncbi:MAG TPA: acylphosphatase [Actinomycetota bacterium]|nr:acylphosphatase [Actinomycetota bacterium]